MAYEAQKWVPRKKVAEVFKIEVETVEELRLLLGATKAEVAYNRGGTILIEWTMMHRESFAGLVGQYIVRNDRGQFSVLDRHELLTDYEPLVEDEVQSADTSYGADLGKLLAVDSREGNITSVMFELPDGTISTFYLPEEETEEIVVEEEPEPEIVEEESYVEPTIEEIEAVNPIEEKKSAPSPADIHRAAKQHYKQEKTDND